MLKWIKRIIWVALGVGIIAGLVVSSLPKPLAVDMQVLKVGPMRVMVEEDGRTRVKDRYVISAPLGGNLARIELDAGDEVEAGTVLARIMPIDPPLLDARTRAGGGGPGSRRAGGPSAGGLDERAGAGGRRVRDPRGGAPAGARGA